MRRTDETADQSSRLGGAPNEVGPAVVGVARLYATDAPCFELRELDRPIVIGRGAECDLPIDDARASRRHARLSRDGDDIVVEDLRSHNGTFVDAARITEPVRIDGEAVLAIGNTVFLVVPDLRPLRPGVEVRDGTVLGPRLRPVWDTIARLAPLGDVLHVEGETGSGKELAARHYHACRCPEGPFIAVNCATVPPLLAEGLLFGARRGAYSGADADRDGYLVAAEGGVLFLDEIGELSLEVQAKLLRAIETHEVLALGAARPRRLDLAVCSATHVDLRAAVARGSFRDDLYFRVANPAVELPPLRARREEIPWLIDAALRGAGAIRAHASFVEAALVRPWPGNVRELLRAVATAASLYSASEAHLKMAHLPERAGRWLTPGREADASTETGTLDPEISRICDTLRAEHGNVTRAAAQLGLHRNQLRRWLRRQNIDARRFKPDLVLGDRDDS